MTIKKSVVDVKTGQNYQEEDLEYDARQPTVTEQVADRLAELEKEITILANEKVGSHIDSIEKAHWMGVADAFTRQHNLWLEEIIIAAKEERMPDEVTYLPLTIEDKELWSFLATIQKLTSTIRQVAKDIAIELYQMTDEQINILSNDWVSTHVLWP